MLEVPVVEWSEGKRAGFTLAAILWDDRSLAHVSSAVTQAELARAGAELVRFGSQDAAAKTRLVRELARNVRGELTGRAEELPPRARALLARQVPRELGRRWIQEAPLPRGGMLDDSALIAALAHFCRSEPAPPDHVETTC